MSQIAVWLKEKHFGLIEAYVGKHGHFTYEREILEDKRTTSSSLVPATFSSQTVLVPSDVKKAWTWGHTDIILAYPWSLWPSSLNLPSPLQSHLNYPPLATDVYLDSFVKDLLYNDNVEAVRMLQELTIITKNKNRVSFVNILLLEYLPRVQSHIPLFFAAIQRRAL